MDFLTWLQQELFKVPQARIAKWLTLLFVGASLYLAALITWQLVPTPDDRPMSWQPQPKAEAPEDKSQSLDGIASLKLFGTPSATPTKPKPKPAEPGLISDAPRTRLRILLTGLVASSVEEQGIAVIQSGGSQETYSIGEKIKATSASLHEVYADRAIILNQGRYETLMLDGIEYTSKPSSETQKLRTRPAGGSNSALRKAKSLILSNPTKLTDYISISPVRRQGRLAGYRLNPGRDRKLFMEAGLKPNDLAVFINGYDLKDTSQSMQVMEQLAELTDISLTVEREGQLVQLQFAIPSE